jgi:hypothetical protein
MIARACDKVRNVVNTLRLRGGRELELVRTLEDALVELEPESRGGASVLRSIDDDSTDAIELDLARLTSVLSRELRAKLVELVIERDGPEVLKRELDRRAELARLLASRGWR